METSRQHQKAHEGSPKQVMGMFSIDGETPELTEQAMRDAMCDMRRDGIEDSDIEGDDE